VGESPGRGRLADHIFGLAAEEHRVIEAIFVVLGVGALSALALLAPHVPIEPILVAGTGCTVFGLVLGVPTGLWYHVKLRAALLQAGRLPERWWIHPVSLHGDIPPERQATVLLWFYIGGVGFGFTMLGCLAVALAVLFSFFAHLTNGY
jgi:hypothetical protein